MCSWLKKSVQEDINDSFLRVEWCMQWQPKIFLFLAKLGPTHCRKFCSNLLFSWLVKKSYNILWLVFSLSLMNVIQIQTGYRDQILRTCLPSFALIQESGLLL